MWGLEQGYFSSPEEAKGFGALLTDILINQRASFNSPVWFNCGVPENTPQMSACFIFPVEDDMRDILEHTKREGMVFKSGSGSGVNVSKLRARGEKLSNKGEASGPVSFMKMWDACAGSVKSGGKSRRSAKLVCMDADHPDIFEFIDCKLHEEAKAKALMGVGYPPEEAYATVAFQNANHSIRVTDEFMEAVENDEDYCLLNRGEKDEYGGYTTVARTVKAKDILRRCAEIAWETGDPGIQFDDRMNEDNPTPSIGRINSTNPCSEFSAIDNSSCNLASLNLVKYLDETHSLNDDLFENDIDIMVTAMDILIDAAVYPTAEVRKVTTETRPLGLGFTNLGAYLMLQGIPYDSEEARHEAAFVTRLMTSAAYRRSSELAEKLGSFKTFEENKEICIEIAKRLVHADHDQWDDGVEQRIIERGLRNSQLTLLAPTGTISFMMDADTTGIEPLFALQATKTLAGGGTMVIAPRCVQDALAQMETVTVGNLSPDRTQQELEISHLPEEKQAIFKTANEIHWKDHILMMAACQKHLNGAISKTVNMPDDCTVDDILKAYTFAWKNGLKSLAIYRDGCKSLQPLQVVKEHVPTIEDVLEEEGPKWSPIRRKLPTTRRSITHKFDVTGIEGFITAGMYEDGTLGEVFLRVQKQGSTINGFMDAFGVVTSLALQYGVPLEALADKMSQTRFDPQGITTDPNIPICTSIFDFIFRWLMMQFKDEDMGPVDESTSLQSIIPPAPKKIDASGPPCTICGSITSRVGTCYLCPSCGASSGCS
jgi:ribonucleoside-diphosphate reductase alpha chain